MSPSVLTVDLGTTVSTNMQEAHATAEYCSIFCNTARRETLRDTEREGKRQAHKERETDTHKERETGRR